MTTKTTSNVTQSNSHLDGIGGIDGNLVISLVTVGQAKVIILNLQVQIREDELKETRWTRGRALRATKHGRRKDLTTLYCCCQASCYCMDSYSGGEEEGEEEWYGCLPCP